MAPFTFNTSASIQFGAGALDKLGALTRARIGERVFIVTDPGMIKTGIVARALASSRAWRRPASPPWCSRTCKPIRRRR